MGYLDKLDLDQKIESKEEYEDLLEEYQFKLLKLQRKVVEKEIAVCIAYEGVDAAGKGGNIKRVTEAIDPRGYEVHAIGAPSPGEKAYHWLRRFWLRLPPRGRISIFDRTWYGRVLVERVEKFCSKDNWKRAYREINDFERALTDDGMILVKFWLHISKKEQLDRFKQRPVLAERNPLSQRPRHQQDIGKHDRRVHAEATHRLQRRLGCQRRVQAEIDKAGRLRPQRVIFR